MASQDYKLNLGKPMFLFINICICNIILQIHTDTHQLFLLTHSFFPVKDVSLYVKQKKKTSSAQSRRRPVDAEI